MIRVVILLILAIGNIAQATENDLQPLVRARETGRKNAIAAVAQNKLHEVRALVPSRLDPVFGMYPNEGIEVFARMIPKGAFDGKADARRHFKNAPTIFYIHGGPGYGSAWPTLAYDWDYDHPDNNTDKANALRALNKYFNVVVMDQRGSAGYTVPLDNATVDQMDFGLVAKLFNQTTLAFDQARVIDWYIKNGWVSADKFYVLGHSFGEMVMWSYMNLIHKGLVQQRPQGLIGASGNKPYGDLAQQWLSTRANLEAYSQRVLAWSLKAENHKAVPFDQLVLNLRQKIQSIGENPDGAYMFYGSSIHSLNEEKAMYEAIESMLRALNDPKQDGKAVYWNLIGQNTDRLNHLNHIMCINALFGGVTIDEMVARAGDLSKPWMLNSFKVFAIEVEETLSRLIQAKANGGFEIPAVYKVTVGDVRDFLKMGIPMAFQAGRWDTLVASPGETERLIELVGDEKLKQRLTITNGTHRDIHQEDTLTQVFKTLGVTLN